MCGIAGIHSVNRHLPDVEGQRALIKNMTDRMKHRGPDADGVWVDAQGRCALGHRRLSIIDVSDAGRQPMHWNEGEWTITFNGEIYNFQEIRRELEGVGVAFHGRTDTEVLLAALAIWGKDALSRLDGMFAFAAFHRDSGELILARDPFGEKPLYYLQLPSGGIAFASELQCLEQVPGFTGEVCADAMAELLMFQYVGAPRSIYKDVKKLPPGHVMTLREGQAPSISRYFQFNPGSDGFVNRSLDDLTDELEDILVRSLKRRLIADVPLGAFLSGGVDSSTVCALVSKKLGRPLKTFSIGFEGAAESEHELARAFAAHLGTEHYDQALSPDTSNFLLNIGRVLDEPNADSSCMPTYLLSEFARQHVTVALSGDGGDEMFAGYGRYFETVNEDSRLGLGFLSGRSAGDAYYSERILVSEERHIDELFEFMPSGLAEHLKRVRSEISAGSVPLICRLRKTDAENYMPGAVLPKVDRMSMQHSLEVRTPFLNVELAKFAEKLPPAFLHKSGKGKILLRELAYRYLPRDWIDAPKRGFGIPVTRWGRDELLKTAEELFKSEDSRLRESFGSEAIDRFLKRQKSLGGFSTYQVWSLSMLESWCRHHPVKLPNLAMERAVRHAASSSDNGALTKTHTLVARSVCTNLFIVFADRESGINSEIGHSYLTSGSLQTPANELRIPGWGEKMDREHLKRLGVLRGSNLWFLDPDSALHLDTQEVQKFSSLGVASMTLRHPHSTHKLLRLRFNIKSQWRQYYDVLRLFIRGKLISVPALRLLLCRKLRGNLFVSRSLSWVPAFPDTELGGSYALFEGFTQMVPVPVEHDLIARHGRGRYSIWNQNCFFSPSVPSRINTSQYWLVKNTPKTAGMLPITAEIIEDGDNFDGFISRLDSIIQNQDPPKTEVRINPGDQVVLLTHALPSGGAERQWCYLAIGLQSLGYDVRFVVYEDLEGDNAHYLNLLQDRGIDVTQLKSGVDLSRINFKITPDSALLFQPGLNPFGPDLIKLTAYLAELQPKAVLAQLDAPNVLAGVACHLANVPRVLLSFRNYNPDNFSYLKNSWFRPLYQTLTKSSRTVLSGNSRLANDDYAQWLSISSDQVAWIPNAILSDNISIPSLENVESLRRELNLNTEEPVLLGVFRLSEEKQPFVFIEVCKHLIKMYPSLRILIAGIGPLRSELGRRIASFDLGDKVTLLGRRDDIPTLMAVSSLLLLTSSHEGMPNVVIEAQLSGLPVVATRTGGTPDCIEGGVTGILCPVGDVDALVEGCSTLLSNPEKMKEMGQLGRIRLLKYWTVELLAKRHIDLLNGDFEIEN